VGQEPTNFEPTGSWCYRFARYLAIPEILAIPEVANGQPVRLVELSRRVLDAHLTKEQQSERYARAKTNGDLTVAASVKFYIPFIAEQTGQLVNLGGGMFRIPTDEDVNEEDLEVAAVDAGVADGVDEASDLDGWMYAFSFPAIQQPDRPFPIKVGKTAGDVEFRVNSQCKQSATFENPIILGRWRVKRVGPMELAVHNVLKARGKWRESVPGTEWFDTTISEIEEIIDFVTKSARTVGA
jgi:hypothetical protein